MITASALLDAGPDGEQQVAGVARRRLRLVTLGRRHWLDGTDAHQESAKPHP
ncbi:hypothetical protein GA0115254_104322 [Streptomyces sp. Ncost-T10-10d]|nr:hypothetical protein GA0115254_104322 [Streptomyces sp. Ncost-T10-10d]